MNCALCGWSGNYAASGQPAYRRGGEGRGVFGVMSFVATFFGECGMSPQSGYNGRAFQRNRCRVASGTSSVRQRTNQEWLGDLKGLNGVTAQNAAYQDLGRYAFTCAYNRVQAKAYTVPSLIGLSDKELRDYAMDFAQITLEKIAAHENALLNQFRNESPFTSWVAKIANNVVLSEFRKAGPQREIRPGRLESDSESGDGTDNDPLDTSWWDQVSRGQGMADGPEQALQQREVYEALVRCLEALPERARTVFLAKEVSGRTGQEIADQLRTTPTAVYTLLTGTRKRLRLCLEESGYR